VACDLGNCCANWLGRLARECRIPPTDCGNGEPISEGPCKGDMSCARAWSRCLLTALVGSPNLATSHEKKGNHVIFALLDTPLKVCIQRIEARRSAKAILEGKESKPFDPQNLGAKYQSTHKNQKRLADAGYDCRTLPYQDPLPPLLQWLDLAETEMALSRTSVSSHRAGNFCRGL
jgi:hypothetical protein